MFKKSQNTQGDLFKLMSNHLSKRKQKLLSDATSWHHVFYQEITSRIDEQVFSVLFTEDAGRPNASIRVMIGMMILKEGNGWSDEQLFEECRFNMKVMMALGFMNLDEDIPVESTYYLFRKLLTEYNTSNGVDLLKQSFEKITQEQIKTYKVSGRKIRLDSKLINSNITVSSRVDLVLESVRVYVKKLDLDKLNSKLDEQDVALLWKLQSKTTTNVSYSLNKEEKELLLKRLGYIIKVLLDCYPNAPQYLVLHRLYQEQYREVDKSDQDDVDTPELRDNKELSSSSIQSIHDCEAAYRSKGHGKKKQQISGYHANITETCDETNELNLIIDAQVESANISENDFLLDSLETCKRVLQHSKEDLNDVNKVIEHASTDGGYDSDENRKSMSEPDMPHWNLSKAKGITQSFIMYRDDDKQLQVIDKKTGTQCEISRTRKGDKVVITIPATKDRKLKRRYYTDEKIENYILLQNILNGIKPEDKNLRANVESTIHQSFHRLEKRNKVKYRGKYKCQMYVISRALWVNLRRICKSLGQNLAYLVILMLSTLIGRQTIKKQNLVIY